WYIFKLPIFAYFASASQIFLEEMLNSLHMLLIHKGDRNFPYYPPMFASLLYTVWPVTLGFWDFSISKFIRRVGAFLLTFPNILPILYVYLFKWLVCVEIY